MKMKKLCRMGLALTLVISALFGFSSLPVYAKEKSYYEISENTSDDVYNIILLGGGGDNKVFIDGKDYGKVNAANIIKVIEEDKINVVVGHSTGANQIELFIKDGSLEEYVDMFVLLDAQVYVGEARYLGGDTAHPVIICSSDQLNRADSQMQIKQYSNYELYYMKGMKHVNMATEHFGDVLDIIHNYYERRGIHSKEELTMTEEQPKPAPETIDLTIEGVWDDADNQDGKRPQKVYYSLYADSKMLEQGTLSADENGSWTCVYRDLPKYYENIEIDYYYEKKNLPDENGALVGYRVVTNRVNGYSTSIHEEDNRIIVENSHAPETVSLKGTITWWDRRNLYQTRPLKTELTVTNDNGVAAKLTVTDETAWKWEAKGLPKYCEGKPLTYKIEADEVEGYSLEVSRYNVSYTRITK